MRYNTYTLLERTGIRPGMVLFLLLDNHVELTMAVNKFYINT